MSGRRPVSATNQIGGSEAFDMRLLLLLTLVSSVFAQQAKLSTVYVYRPQATLKGRWTHPSIYCDGVELTRIYRGTVFRTTVPPGKHIITLGRTEVGQFVNIEPGADYYFR